MFKRVTKKQEKRKELEELGLSDVVNDDSSDSSSESDSEEDRDSEDEEQDGRMAEGSDDDMVEAADADENGSDEEDGEFDDDPPMTIEGAKGNPIYLASEETDIHGCIVCPAKKLKNKNLIAVHVESSSHKRRFGRFLEAIKDTTYGTDDPRLIVEAISTLTQTPLTSITGVLSNRGKKRREKMEKIRNMRTVQKEMKAKAIRKRDAKRAESTKAAGSGEEDGGTKEGKEDKAAKVLKKSSKGKGKINELEGPAKKKRRVSKDASQKVTDFESTAQPSAHSHEKTKRSAELDTPSAPPLNSKKSSESNAKKASVSEPSERDKPKKRKRPSKSRSSE